MFTGIVQGTAKLVSIDEKPNFRTHVVELPDHMLDGLETGASGEVTPTRFCVHLIPETLERTTLGKKKLGARVNIEIDPQTQAVVDTVERVLAARENAMNQPGTEA